jgi:hypothetical protein
MCIVGGLYCLGHKNKGKSLHSAQYFSQVFSVYSGLNLRMWNPWVWRAFSTFVPLNFFFVIMWFELRAPHLLGWHSTTWATSPAHVFFLFFWDWGLNSGLHAYKTGILLLRVCLQSILLWFFWRWSLTNYLPSWPQTLILLISASWVARITCVSCQRLVYWTFLSHCICDNSSNNATIIAI